MTSAIKTPVSTKPGGGGAVGRWWVAIRPRTLPIAMAPVLVGAGVSFNERSVSWAAVFLAMSGAILLTTGANLANDLFDYLNGADAPDRIGPVRVTQAGWLTPTQMRWGIAWVFLAATVIGVILTRFGGWPVIGIGLLAILAAFLYTGGPWPLGYHGLGELLVFVFYGPVAVGGTVWVATHSMPWLCWVVSVPIGLLAVAILLVNNIRDVATDQRANKRTLVVLLGRRIGIRLYSICLGVSAASPIWMWISGAVSWTILLPLLLIHRMWKLNQVVTNSTNGPVLNAALASTAKVLVGYAGLLFAGLML